MPIKTIGNVVILAHRAGGSGTAVPMLKFTRKAASGEAASAAKWYVPGERIPVRF